MPTYTRMSLKNLAAPSATLALALTALPAGAHDIRADVLSKLTLADANRLIVGTPNTDQNGCDWRVGEVYIGSTPRGTNLTLKTEDGEIYLSCYFSTTPPLTTQQPASQDSQPASPSLTGLTLIADRPAACQKEKETVGEIQDSLAEAAGDEPNGKITKNLRKKLKRALGALDDCRRKHPSAEPTKPMGTPKSHRETSI